MRKTAIKTAGAPAAIGPYSQAVQAGSLVFVSGQLPIDPRTGEFAGLSAADQAAQSLKNIAAILAEVGLGLKDVLKTTVYLTDMADFESVNAVYAEHFDTEPLPARSTVAVAGLPKAALVEIEVIALLN
ncbi:MAG: RidA family protein [Propionibacteriaceae bacterium]|jgi:2-iminobutanoate/2-iminopropanoate deaminase|nr:RidA family protein [Propionibacteriaceae bacterium]